MVLTVDAQLVNISNRDARHAVPARRRRKTTISPATTAMTPTNATIDRPVSSPGWSPATAARRVLLPARSITTCRRPDASPCSLAADCFLAARWAGGGACDFGAVVFEGTTAVVDDGAVVAASDLVGAFVVGVAVVGAVVVGAPPFVAGPGPDGTVDVAVSGTPLRVAALRVPVAVVVVVTSALGLVVGATGVPRVTGEIGVTGASGLVDGLVDGGGPAETEHTWSNGTFAGRSPFPHFQPSLSPSRTWAWAAPTDEYVPSW